MANKMWDVFISHASEDKQVVVKPLAKCLEGLGAKVWYDEFEILLGDSLSRSLDKGLASSRFGIVVLSPDFFQKDWPEYELRGLIAKEVGRDKVIIPIWHNVEKEDVLSFSPPLADKLALKTSEHPIEELAVKILEVIRPDLLEYHHKRIAFQEAVQNAKISSVDPKTLKHAPIRHDELPEDIVGRIRLIRAALMIPYPQTMEFWLDGFKRDMHPHREIEFWEHLAARYVEYAAIIELTLDQHKAAFRYIFGVLQGLDDEALEKNSSELPAESLSQLRDSCHSRMPIYEFTGLPSSVENRRGPSEEE